MDFRQRRANGRHESALSLKSFKVKRLSQLSLSLLVLYSTFEHLFPPLSTHLVSTVYNLRWEREREKEMLSRQTGAPSTFYLWPVKKPQKSPFFLLWLRCFSLSLSTIFGRVRGRKIIRGGRANTKVYADVCGFSFFDGWPVIAFQKSQVKKTPPPHCVCKQRSGCYGLLKRLETSSAGWRMNRSHLSASFRP